MKIKVFKAALFLPVLLVSCQVFAQTSLSKVILIRHAEKPASGDNLSCKGFNRSLQLVSVLQKKFGVVNEIYVPSINNGKTTNHARMFQTIAPYAIKNNLEINSKYKEEDTKEVAAAIRQSRGNIIVVWEHKDLSKIAKQLGVDVKNKWEDEDFDTIWIITYVSGKAQLSIDKENITPSGSCSY